jgi:antitoxin (DNA-binding transcriptional repressor) of toxin-antitoxin stability system
MELSTSTPLSMREATHHLAHYVEQAQLGKRFSIMRHGSAMAMLVPITDANNPTSGQVQVRQIKQALSIRSAKPYGTAGQVFDRQDAYAL